MGRLPMVLTLCLAVFAASVTVDACLCGSACRVGLQGPPLCAFPLHPRCGGTDCRSCRLEDGRALKAAAFQARSDQGLGSEFSPSGAAVIRLLGENSDTGTGGLSAPRCQALPFAPAYLRHRALRC